ncbi:MAG: hypothetical protein LUQ47_04045 [Methanotrichaceae archaeon]|nr:hypothetical protein [Methanotrichaceae archaeon]
MINDEEESLSAFLKDLGFTNDELRETGDELNAYRSIPGTTLKRYVNRILATIEDGERPAFLKGLWAGIAIRKTADTWVEPVLTEEEKRIDHEIEKLGSHRQKTSTLDQR